ncbi:MAG: hypothetical protein D6824_10185, partial [Planctomycetota bacterium]
MAKRIFEIAKELGVKSKAIVEKCKAEGVPGVKGHMSSVSAGLEATIREWFDAPAGGVATAVETAEHVDIEKVRATPRKAKAKAKAQPRRTETPPAATQTTQQPQEATVAATTAAPTAVPQQQSPAAAGSETQAPPLAPAAQAEQEDAEAAGAPRGAVAAPTQGGEEEDASTKTPSAPPRPPAPPKVRMNVPERPKTVAPAGPKLEKTKPAKLSGPKVIRVEQPDPIPPPRPRRPAGGASVPVSRGPRAGGGVALPPDTAGRGRSARRNKRRAGDERSRGGRPGAPAEQGGGRWRSQDLIEREERLMRAGGFLRQRRRDMKKSGRAAAERPQTPAQRGGTVKIAAPFTIKELSAATGVKSSEIIKKLFMQGVMANVNSGIDPEKAA